MNTGSAGMPPMPGMSNSSMGMSTGSVGMSNSSMGMPPMPGMPNSMSSMTMGMPPSNAPPGLPGMMGGRRRTRKASKTANNAKNAKAANNAKATRSKVSRGKMPMRGSKAQVWHGTAHHTTGGLMKKDLMMTKNGRIVSRKKHALGKKALRRLVKAGYKAKKGTFKLFKRGK